MSRGLTVGTVGLATALVVGAVAVAPTRDTGQPATSRSSSVDSRPSVTPVQEPLGLAIVGLDGTVRKDLGLPTDAWMPDLSPDGSRIMFITASTKVGFCGGCSSLSPLNDRIAAIPLGDSAGAFIYLNHSTFSSVEQPVWSPSWNQIAFVGVRKQDGNHDIYAAKLKEDDVSIISGRIRRLTVDRAVDESRRGPLMVRRSSTTTPAPNPSTTPGSPPRRRSGAFRPRAELPHD
jgi:hypothetical protein